MTCIDVTDLAELGNTYNERRKHKLTDSQSTVSVNGRLTDRKLIDSSETKVGCRLNFGRETGGGPTVN